jgi:N-acetylgalactosamine kinase
MSVSIAGFLRALESNMTEGNLLFNYFSSGYCLPEDRERVVQRYRRIAELFAGRFEEADIMVARAPGRINLIGEHTDYNGLPVLPMAINRDIASVFSPRSDKKIVLTNTDCTLPERVFEIEDSIPPYPTGDWGNYCKAGVQGIIDHYRERNKPICRLRGLQAAIEGDIPSAAGMSSSSALVVLSALIFLAANKVDTFASESGRLDLAELLAKAEHYVGTRGGGMDQAISLLAQPDRALKIDFFPLRASPTPLPAGHSFVVSNSLVQAAKTESALQQYNRRPVECRLAAAVLKKTFSDRYEREVPLFRLGDLREDRLAIVEEEIREIADNTLHQGSYSLAEIASILGKSPEQTAHIYCAAGDGSVFPEPEDGFKLESRYRHITEEGRRVEASVQALVSGDIAGFGELMYRSHISCRDLYEISCPEMDELVEISRRAGAIGARLTGAGFGGCTISLVPDDEIEVFMERLIEDYYRDFLKLKKRDYSSILFPCRAVAGAGVLDLQTPASP